MRWAELFEASDAPLYHATSFIGAKSILRDGHIQGWTKPYVCATRDKNLMFKRQHVQFILNVPKIKTRYRIEPFDYYAGFANARKDSEERIMTDRLPIQMVSAIMLMPLKGYPRMIAAAMRREGDEIADLARERGLEVIDRREVLVTEGAEHLEWKVFHNPGKHNFRAIVTNMLKNRDTVMAKLGDGLLEFEDMLLRGTLDEKGDVYLGNALMATHASLDDHIYDQGRKAQGDIWIDTRGNVHVNSLWDAENQLPMIRRWAERWGVECLGRSSLAESAEAPQWEPELEDNHAIADYIESVSVSYIDHERCVENYRGCRAVLRLVPIEEIDPKYEAHHERIASREVKYAKMDPRTMPPLLIDRGVIEDGYHRYRVAKQLGMTALWCYEIIDDVEEDDTDYNI